MSDRRHGLGITLSNVGAGTVVRNVPPEELIQPNPTGVITAAASPTSANVRLFEGLAVRRDGYTVFGESTGDTDFVNGVFVAVFDEQTRYLMRGWANANQLGGGQVQFRNESGAVWTTITGSDVGASLPTQPWVFAMTPNPASSPASILLFANETTAIYRWNGSTPTATVIPDTNAPRGPHAIVSFLSRAFAFNVIEPTTGHRKSTRLQWSKISDSLDWTSLTSGSLDLDDDPFPGVAALVIGGRLVLFKGGPDGGAIYVATPTGISTAPLRIDAINPGTNVGVVVPRSVVPITSTLCFFLGHDAAYLYDGVRALLPFAEGVARDITSRLNISVLDTGFALYNPDKREVELHVATGSATTPNETWRFDIRGQRAYGPDNFANSFMAGDVWLSQGALTWDTLGQAAARTWDNLVSGTTALPYVQWDRIDNGLGSRMLVYGATGGNTYSSASANTTDNGTAIACDYRTPPVTPKDWVVGDPQSPQGRRLRSDDILVLREIQLRHRSLAAWTPVVEVSTDGSTFVLVSDGTQAAATGSRVLTKTYYVPNTSPPSVWHQVRVKNTAGDAFNIKDIILNFTYAGSARHE